MVVGHGINFSRINEVLDCIFEGFGGIGGVVEYLVEVTVKVWVDMRW